jgi:2-C-methyl-D-erythritol 4-phosphate cytidylyltransferase
MYSCPWPDPKLIQSPIMDSFAVIIPAAGASSRFGQNRNKLLEDLEGRSVVQRSIDAFRYRADVEAIILPTRGEIQVDGEKIFRCNGGATRADSVLAGVNATPAHIEWVAVHDAARPVVSQELIDRTFKVATERGAAVPALAVHLTIKQAEGPLPAKVERTVPRQKLWAMQTPQVMRKSALLDAFERCPIPLEQVTDDVQLLELTGGEVWLVDGEERNLKITTAMDFQLAKMYLSGMP